MLDVLDLDFADLSGWSFGGRIAHNFYPYGSKLLSRLIITAAKGIEKILDWIFLSLGLRN